ncbi:MAG: hypothetical protein AB7P76_02760 [Candidatus Melainabacteria bacterium]
MSAPSFDFKCALLYPFRQENRAGCVWVPGGLIYLSFAVTIVLGVGAFVSMMADGGASLQNPESMNALQGSPQMHSVDFLGNIVSLILQVVLGSYTWHLTGALQTGGLLAPAPAWFSQFSRLVVDGLKVTIYWFLIGIVVGIVMVLALLIPLGSAIISSITHPDAWQETLTQSGPMVLGIFVLVMLGLFAATPFLITPVFNAARTRHFAQLFDLKPAWQLAGRYYGRIWAGIGLNIALCLIYFVAMMATGITIIGLLTWPFLMAAWQMSSMHLMTQAVPVTTDPTPDSNTPSIISPA